MKHRLSGAALALLLALPVLQATAAPAPAPAALGPVTQPLWLRQSALSPDGRQLAFTFQGNLFVMPAGGRARAAAGVQRPPHQRAGLVARQPAAGLCGRCLRQQRRVRGVGQRRPVAAPDHALGARDPDRVHAGRPVRAVLGAARTCAPAGLPVAGAGRALPGRHRRRPSPDPAVQRTCAGRRLQQGRHPAGL
jgi:hypothetical protein